MRQNSGYTLIELLVVAVLAVLLLSLAVPGFHTWTRSSSSEQATTVFSSELRRARAHALARACTTRVRVIPDDMGDFVISERLDMEDMKSWYPITGSNRLERTCASVADVFFRTDGSCTTNDALIEAAADFDKYYISLAPYDGIGSGTALSLDSRTGLFETYYFKGLRTEEDTNEP